MTSPSFEQLQLDWSSRGLTAVSLRIHDAGVDWERVVTWSLAENKLTVLPSSLADRLAGLRYLNLKANALTEFPRVLCDMQRLEILDLSRNKITHFPDSLGALASTLKVFSIAKNRITLIPEYFGDMNQLEVFKLDGNPIQWPPAEVIASVSDGVPTHLKEFLKLNVTPIHLLSTIDSKFGSQNTLQNSKWTIYRQSPSVSLTIVEQSPPHPQLLPAPSFSLSQIIETHLQTPSFTKNTSISIKCLLQASSTLHTQLTRLLPELHRAQPPPPSLEFADIFGLSKVVQDLETRVLHLVWVLERDVPAVLAEAVNDGDSTADGDNSNDVYGMNGSVVGGRLSDRSSKQGGGIPSVVVPPGVIQQSVVDVVESLRRAIEVGVLVFQQSQYGGNGLDLRILRSIATGIYSAQMELFDAIEALGEKKEIGMINDVSVNAANVSGETEWRFKKRKEVCQLADAIIETGKATLIEMKGLVDVDPATVVLFAAVDAGFTSFAKCRNRLNGASSLDFALFQSFGEDTVAFVQIVAEAAATLQTFPSRPEIAKAKQMLKKTGIASKNLALLLLQN